MTNPSTPSPDSSLRHPYAAPLGSLAPGFDTSQAERVRHWDRGAKSPHRNTTAKLTARAPNTQLTNRPYAVFCETDNATPAATGVSENSGQLVGFEQLGDEGRDRGPLGTGERDVSKQWMPLESFDHGGDPVVSTDPQVVALRNVVGEHDA